MMMMMLFMMIFTLLNVMALMLREARTASLSAMLGSSTLDILVQKINIRYKIQECPQYLLSYDHILLCNVIAYWVVHVGYLGEE